MKTPDNNEDEALQKALRRKFDDFAPEPDPSWKKGIFDTLQTSNRTAYIRPLLIATALIAILFFTGIEYDFISIKMITKSDISNKETNVRRDSDREIKSKNEITAEKSETISDLTSSLPEPGKLLLSNNGNMSVKKVKEEKTHVVSKVEIVQDHLESKRNEVKTLTEAATERIINQLYIEKDSLPDMQLTKISPDKELLKFDIPKIKPLEIRAFIASNFKPALKINKKELARNEQEKPGMVKTKKELKFLFNVTSMNTFQELTVRATPGIVYQNIGFPTKFSAKRLGTKLSGGVEKNGFQLLLTYGQFDQSFQYEIATDEFLVNDKNQMGDKIIRKGIKHDEKSTMKLIGIGLKKHSLITKNHVFRNYYGDVGMEYSRELTTRSNVLWGNAGIGKEIRISKNTSLTIGPYLEYSFIKLINPDSKFQVRPYQIGIAAGLRFGNR
ncbi:hypothetical protein [Dyadobacter sp. CY356]|uniref:hypothetical protein n=1 Tax=Dyadobacter sp. CY356 TaxID=2906442 RepID=UPI001F170551|nr:hypothetical protein [Dyadobacter sp. CY356]MCF0056280.1 hypothetical protein [Dyadobacter sp. CY356]